jgi:replicative superfamily II helicase
VWTDGRESSALSVSTVCPARGLGEGCLETETWALFYGTFWDGVFARETACLCTRPGQALAAEVAGKLRRSLGPLGRRVRELTGDSGLTRTELRGTDVVVATPEKWDVISRRLPAGAGAGGGAAGRVRLLVIDEVRFMGREV